MSAALCDYSFTIALVMFTVGKVSASPTLTILNNKSHLECGTMQTVLTCELQTPLDFTMQWFVDGTSVSRCDKQSCSRKDGMSSNYNATVTAVGNIFKFDINPVDIFDNRTFSCTDGDPSNYIQITTEEVKINKTLTTITNTTWVNNVEFVVTTSCVFHPDAVKLSLESKKVSGSGGFTSFQVESKNTAIVCSNTENAYCGGNKTSKPQLVFAISTNATGELHQFKLHLIQTLENGHKYTITFENDEIGPLRLPTPTTTTPSPPKSLCCLEHLSVYMPVIIVGLIICITLCIIIYSWCKRKVNGITKLEVVRAAVVAAADAAAAAACRHEIDTREDHTSTNRSHEPEYTNVDQLFNRGTNKRPGRNTGHNYQSQKDRR